MRNTYKSEKIVDLIVKAYDQKKGVFKNRINAEDFVPKNASNKNKSLFLFYIIQLDYAVKSKYLYKRGVKLFNENPNYFTPIYILNLSKTKLYNLLINRIKPRYINEAVKRWQINSNILIEKYKSNPLNIFNTSKDALIVLKSIRNFRGFGPKIGNFVLRTCINVFNFELKNIDKVFQPVDRHNVRLTYEWGFLSNKKMSIKNINNVKNIWQKACKEADVSWLKFDRALWIFGSEKGNLESII